GDDSVQVVAAEALDARWIADGRIVVVDRRARVRYFKRDATPFRATWSSRGLDEAGQDVPCVGAEIAASGDVFAALAGSLVFVVTVDAKFERDAVTAAKRTFWAIGSEYRVSLG